MALSPNRQKSRVSEMYRWGEEEGRASPGTFHNIGFEHNEGKLAISVEITIRIIGKMGDRRPGRDLGSFPISEHLVHIQWLPWNLGQTQHGDYTATA